MKKIIFMAIASLLINTANADNIDHLRMIIGGCFEGVDKNGISVRGKVTDFYNTGNSAYELRLNNNNVNFLEIAFYQSNNKAIVTQVFNEGQLIDSRTLNKRISYQFRGPLERFLMGGLLSSLENETLISIEEKSWNSFVFEIYQNDNTDLVHDRYWSHEKSNYVTYIVKRVDC